MIKQLDHGLYAPVERTTPPLIAWVVLSTIMLSGLVDLPREITLGPITSLALLTVAYAFSAWTLWIVRPIFFRPAIMALCPFVVLLIWCCASFLWYAPSVPGVQNVLVLSTFVGLALLVSYECYRAPRFAERVRTTIVRAVWLAAALYVISLLLGALGFGELMGPRSFALFALLGVSCHLAAWRHGRTLGFWQAILLTLLIGVSLSRTALLVALMLFPLSHLSLKHYRSWLRVILMTALIAILAYLAVTYIEPLNERFFAGDRAVSVEGVEVNTSGRTEIWGVVWDSYVTSPLIGLGAGSAEEVLAQDDPKGESWLPHNDYLRYLHDYGPLGLGLLCLGILCCLWTIGRGWVGASSRGDPEASLHLAAFLGLTGATLAMITDNLVVYIFVMAPLGALTGASLGRVWHQLQKHV